MHPQILAAEGWIKLGNYDEAAKELNSCSTAVTASIEWLKFWIRVCAGTNRWREVEASCETLAKRAPNDPFAIFNKAEALHRQGRSREAYEALNSESTRFKRIPQFYYDSARYLCGMGELDLTWSSLNNAFDLDKGLRLCAQNDPDFEDLGLCFRNVTKAQWKPAPRMIEFDLVWFCAHVFIVAIGAISDLPAIIIIAVASLAIGSVLGANPKARVK